jgi:single-strand DNA-binding protein
MRRRAVLPEVYGEFRVVEDPELRFSPSGMAVANVRVVADKKKKEGDEWVDDKILWLKVTVFRQMAENMVESIRKGDLVLIIGRLQTDSWETNEGEKRSQITCVAEHVGLSVKWNVVKAERTERSTGAKTREAAKATASSGGDPWGTPESQPDEPPF